MRHVRTLRLSAASQQLVRRGSILVEDALRTASLPETDAGRLYVVRSLDLGTIGARNSSSSVALALERSFARAQVSAVHASDPRAGSASVVYFHDVVEAHVLLTVRLASGAEVRGEWFWSLAVPSFRVEHPRDEALRSVLLSAISLPAGPAAAVLLVSTLLRAGVADTLLGALRWQDGPLLVRATQLGSTHAAMKLELPRLGDDLRVVERWARTWGTNDSRSVWLAAVALAAQSPVRILDEQHLARAERLLAEIARAPHAPSSPTTTSSSWERQKVNILDMKREKEEEEFQEKVYKAVNKEVQEVKRTTHRNGEEVQEVDVDLDLEVNLDADVEESRLPPPGSGSASPSASAPSAPSPPPPPNTFVEESRWVSVDPLPTEYAGLYFVLRLLQRLHIAAAPDALELDLGTRVLRRLAMRLRIPEDDPVLQPLAEVDALELQADAITARWLSDARKLCRRSARIGLSALVRRHGTIAFTRTHIDVTFALSSVDIRLRRGGLDIDPGWLPWFGRVVLFHYDG